MAWQKSGLFTPVDTRNRIVAVDVAGWLIWRDENLRDQACEVSNAAVSHDLDTDGEMVIQHDHRTSHIKQRDYWRLRALLDEWRTPEERRKQAKSISAWTLTRGDAVKMERVRWLWPGVLAEGELTTWTGEMGSGKSLSAIELGVRLSKGEPWPDGTPNEGNRLATLYVSGEESFEYTVLPRWVSAGGDPAKLYRFDLNGADPLRFESNLPELTQLVANTMDTDSPIGLVIFDPISENTDRDTLNDQEIRAMLLKVKAWIVEEGIAAIGILHVNKKNDLSAMQRATGAKAWIAVPRINMLVGLDAEGTRHLVTLKTNIHKPVSFAFAINTNRVSIENAEVEVERARWLSASNATADDLLGAKKTSEKKASAAVNTVEADIRSWFRRNVPVDGKAPDVVISELQSAFPNATAGKSRRTICEWAKDAGVDVKARTTTAPARGVWKYVDATPDCPIPAA